jgi:RecA-family ATPase
MVPTLRDRDEGQECDDADDETAQSTTRTSVLASRASTAVGLTWTAKRNKATIFAKTIEYIRYLEAQQHQQQDDLIFRLRGLERENKAMRSAVRAFSKWFNGMKKNPDHVAEGTRSGSADAWCGNPR